MQRFPWLVAICLLLTSSFALLFSGREAASDDERTLHSRTTGGPLLLHRRTITMLIPQIADLQGLEHIQSLDLNTEPSRWVAEMTTKRLLRCRTQVEKLYAKGARPEKIKALKEKQRRIAIRGRWIIQGIERMAKLGWLRQTAKEVKGPMEEKGTRNKNGNGVEKQRSTRWARIKSKDRN